MCRGLGIIIYFLSSQHYKCVQQKKCWCNKNNNHCCSRLDISSNSPLKLETAQSMPTPRGRPLLLSAVRCRHAIATDGDGGGGRHCYWVRTYYLTLGAPFVWHFNATLKQSLLVAVCSRKPWRWSDYHSKSSKRTMFEITQEIKTISDKVNSKTI